MMNQKAVIYIILSAILLYLYYRKKDFTIFVAFAVVAGATLIFRSATIGEEGFGIGGGGGGDDKECAKLGLKPIKLDKNDLPGGLEKVYKIIKPVVEKHFQYNDDFQKFMSEFGKEAQKLKEDDAHLAGSFIQNSVDFYFQGKRDNLIDNPDLAKIISGGKVLLKILEKLSKSSELESNIKKIVKNLICLCKYCINIYKEVQKPTGGGGGGGDKGGDDGEDGNEEKPKKKNTKKNVNKKKKKSGDDEDAADEDE